MMAPDNTISANTTYRRGRAITQTINRPSSRIDQVAEQLGLAERTEYMRSGWNFGETDEAFLSMYPAARGPDGRRRRARPADPISPEASDQPPLKALCRWFGTIQKGRDRSLVPRCDRRSSV